MEAMQAFSGNIMKEAWETAKCLCCTACCLLVSGPTLLIIGLILIFSPDTRKHKIETFNSAVDDWGATYRAQFKDIAPVYAHVNNHTRTKLSENTQNDPLKDEDDKLEDYSPLKYRGSVTAFGKNEFDTDLTTTIKIYHEQTDVGSFDIQPFIQHQENVGRNGSSTCINNGGEFKNPYCTYYMKASEICVKVSKDSQFSISSEYGGNGCKYGDLPQAREKVGKWNPVTYETTSPPSSGKTYDGTWPLTVRDLHDPYIKAEKLTDGSLKFGLSKSAKIIIGFICIGFGCCFLLPFCIILGVIIYFIRSRRANKNQYAQFQNPPPSQPPYAPQYQNPPPPQGYGGAPQYGQPGYGW